MFNNVPYINKNLNLKFKGMWKQFHKFPICASPVTRHRSSPLLHTNDVNFPTTTSHAKLWIATGDWRLFPNQGKICCSVLDKSMTDLRCAV